MIWFRENWFALSVVTVALVVLIWHTAAKGEPLSKGVASDCRALRELNQEYKGKPLSEEEKVVKAQLFTWYKRNCKRTVRK